MVDELTDRIRRNLEGLRARIAAAAARAGRDPAAVALLPVTKMQGASETAALLECGVSENAENREMDALRKAGEMGAAAGRFRWQLVGHLQTNKVRKALELFSGMHSLDSARLAEALEKELAKPQMNTDEHRYEQPKARDSGPVVQDGTAALAVNQEPGTGNPEPSFPVFVEVNTSGDAAKTGAAEADVRAIFGKLRECPHLVPAGLMTMGPLSGGPEAARPCFRRLGELLATLRAEGLAPASCQGLSMGMTGDFEVAVEEGATVVRLGTAVFE
jgi:hypothetical protein